MKKKKLNQNGKPTRLPTIRQLRASGIKYIPLPGSEEYHALKDNLVKQSGLSEKKVRLFLNKVYLAYKGDKLTSGKIRDTRLPDSKQKVNSGKKQVLLKHHTRYVTN